jgi:hypothetical protein
MQKYRFQIQSCIEVETEADTKEDARIQIVDNLKQYAEQMTTSSCYVSDGVEVII